MERDTTIRELVINYGIGKFRRDAKMDSEFRFDIKKWKKKKGFLLPKSSLTVNAYRHETMTSKLLW